MTHWTRKPWPQHSQEQRKANGHKCAARAKYMRELGREPEDYDEVLFLKQWRIDNPNSKG